MTDAVIIGPPHMSSVEMDYFAGVLKQTRRYFEFGIGGSTLLAIRSGVETIVSVDSDPKWTEAVKSHEEIAPRIADRSVSVIHGDIGPVRDWGNPIDRSRSAQWPQYIQAGWTEWQRRGELPEVVLVDGRFRMACCLSVYLATCSVAAAILPTVFLHDFNEERLQYREILDVFAIDTQVDSLCQLRIRPDVSAIRAFTTFLERQFDFG